MLTLARKRMEKVKTMIKAKNVRDKLSNVNEGWPPTGLRTKLPDSSTNYADAHIRYYGRFIFSLTHFPKRIILCKYNYESDAIKLGDTIFLSKNAAFSSLL